MVHTEKNVEEGEEGGMLAEGSDRKKTLGRAISDSMNDRGYLLESLRVQGSKWIQGKAPQAISEPIQMLEQPLNSFTVPESRCASFRKRMLVEVFEVVFLEPRNVQFHEDVIIMVGSNKHVLWDKSCGQFNSDDDLILSGPKYGIEVEDFFYIHPAYSEDDDLVKWDTLWWNPFPPDDDPSRDYFVSKNVETRNGIMEVKFAVYRDAVEARVEVALSDLELESLSLDRGGEPLKVYGTVKASNSVSTHSEAKSVLFDHIMRSECVALEQNKGVEMFLPLSRSVTVLPRESTLLVDVSLYLYCTTGDICIANGSALFHARTRSSGVAEERIILGNGATVKVKALWVEGEEEEAPAPAASEPLEREVEAEGNLTGGGELEEGEEEEEEEGVEEDEEGVGEEEEEEEEEEKGSIKRRASTSTEESCQTETGSELFQNDPEEKDFSRRRTSIGSEGSCRASIGSEVSIQTETETGCELYEDDPEEKGSMRSLKVPRLDWHDDVSTRSGECSLTEPMESQDEELGARLVNKQFRRFPKSLLELFSVRFIEYKRPEIPEMHGFILLETSMLACPVFKRVHGDPLRIESEGFVMLEGPTRDAVTIYNNVYINPFLFKHNDVEFEGKDISYGQLWNTCDDYPDSLDKVLCKTLDSSFGPLEVIYAVYRDAVKAHLKVVLKDCCFSSVKVHGTMSAANSDHFKNNPTASSKVFNRKEDEAVPCIVKAGAEAELPLCRPIIALPYGSDLLLDVALHSGDRLILSEKFQFNNLMQGVNRKTIPGKDCSVEVIVDLVYSMGCF